MTTNARDLQLLIVRDVTSEARLESMRQDFVANASHELRSPLTVVGGYLDSLAEDPRSTRAGASRCSEMQRQSERMRGIVQDLLELSRLEAGGGEAEQAPVDVARHARADAQGGAGAARAPGAGSSCTSTSDALLLGAETELHSIFHNLVSNAVKYTPADGRVDIRWWTDAAGGHVAVATPASASRPSTFRG